METFIRAAFYEHTDEDPYELEKCVAVWSFLYLIGGAVGLVSLAIGYIFSVDFFKSLSVIIALAAGIGTVFVSIVYVMTTLTDYVAEKDEREWEEFKRRSEKNLRDLTYYDYRDK